MFFGLITSSVASETSDVLGDATASFAVTIQQQFEMLVGDLILTVVIGLIAESSVFAADPTPAPSPEKGATTETASPSPSPEKKTRRRARVEARRTGRQQRREGRQEAREARGPEASPTPAAKPSPTPKQ
jgi:uncharacterized membrane protein